MMKSKIKYLSLGLLFIALMIVCVPHLFYKNSGISTSIGTTESGSLENAYQIDYNTNNCRYFSPISFYLLGSGYVNAQLYNTLIQTYKACETACPNVDFRIMECSNKQGGKMPLHRTHRNGLSVDFMVPLLKNGKQNKFYDRLGLWHYLLQFDSSGN